MTMRTPFNLTAVTHLSRWRRGGPAAQSIAVAPTTFRHGYLLRGLLALLLTPAAAFGQGISFPPGAVVDVVAEYPGVQPDDGMDDTAGLQQALLDYAETNRILWLRDGVYDVSDTLAFQGALRFNTIQGQSRDGVIIRLTDNAPGFDDPDTPKA
ncbi:MAG: hypothetical protein EA376_12980 [Phycisphaeraceae bacterium]|nr:MAG: hypothetical protein EA376_12980 [Phycisphaeraceae bacterium]